MPPLGWCFSFPMNEPTVSKSISRVISLCICWVFLFWNIWNLELFIIFPFWNKHHNKHHNSPFSSDQVGPSPWCRTWSCRPRKLAGSSCRNTPRPSRLFLGHRGHLKRKWVVPIAEGSYTLSYIVTIYTYTDIQIIIYTYYLHSM